MAGIAGLALGETLQNAVDLSGSSVAAVSANQASASSEEREQNANNSTIRPANEESSGTGSNLPSNEPPRSSGPVFATNAQAAAKAKELGYTKINERINGQSVFKKGNRYITRDVDGHNGGAWKAAESVQGLAKKETRLGTYDSNLNRIGD